MIGWLKKLFEKRRPWKSYMWECIDGDFPVGTVIKDKSGMLYMSQGVFSNCNNPEYKTVGLLNNDGKWGEDKKVSDFIVATKEEAMKFFRLDNKEEVEYMENNKKINIGKGQRFIDMLKNNPGPEIHGGHGIIEICFPGLKQYIKDKGKE